MNAVSAIRKIATIMLLVVAMGIVTRPTTAGWLATPAPAPASQGLGQLRIQVRASALTGMRWPDFSDYFGQANLFYARGGYQLAWVSDGRPTPQALAMIQAFKHAGLEGLNPEDYDASRWNGRIAKLDPGTAKPTSIGDDEIRFDLAMTVCAMRYLSALNVGRVNPHHVKFSVALDSKTYDLADFLRDRILPASDVGAAITEVEPHYAGYARAKIALATYMKLSAQGDGTALPRVDKGIRPGGDYAGIPQLAVRLRQLGDLPADAKLPDRPTAYSGAMVEAVKHFQQRHGLEPDGILGKGTIADLNTPLSHRVQQIEFALERYRWIPPAFYQPPIIINLPQFILRTMRRQPAPFLTMRVIVGKAYRKQTPVFAGKMQYVIFRPYWNVPRSIETAELLPKIIHDRDYLASHGFEVVDGNEVVSDGAVSDDVLEELREGNLNIRQKPGPKNSLGLVKFIFPNAYNVYLHGTPETELFAKARRDFSHGCIRVQDPVSLAAWVLRKNPDWDRDKIAAAMDGDQTIQVNLAKPIPVLILYGTAWVEPDGEVEFFRDIYHYDSELQDELAHGYPYPGPGTELSPSAVHLSHINEEPY